MKITEYPIAEMTSGKYVLGCTEEGSTVRMPVAGTESGRELGQYQAGVHRLITIQGLSNSESVRIGLSSQEWTLDILLYQGDLYLTNAEAESLLDKLYLEDLGDGNYSIYVKMDSPGAIFLTYLGSPSPVVFLDPGGENEYRLQTETSVTEFGMTGERLPKLVTLNSPERNADTVYDARVSWEIFTSNFAAILKTQLSEIGVLDLIFNFNRPTLRKTMSFKKIRFSKPTDPLNLILKYNVSAGDVWTGGNLSGPLHFDGEIVVELISYKTENGDDFLSKNVTIPKLWGISKNSKLFDGLTVNELINFVNNTLREEPEVISLLIPVTLAPHSAGFVDYMLGEHGGIPDGYKPVNWCWWTGEVSPSSLALVTVSFVNLTQYGLIVYTPAGNAEEISGEIRVLCIKDHPL